MTLTSNNVTTFSSKPPADPERDKQVFAMLERYDAMRLELRLLEDQLKLEASEFGKRHGSWGAGISYLRHKRDQ